MIEEWEQILEYVNRYWISNIGRLKNSKGQILNPPISERGYYRVSLFKDGKSKNYMVHRLVAKAFIPNINNKPYVNHKDGIKTNNYVDNLEWVTNAENVTHSYAIGTSKSRAKYKIKCIELDIVANGCENMKNLLNELGYKKVWGSSIWRCIKKKNTNHLGLTFITVE